MSVETAFKAQQNQVARQITEQVNDRQKSEKCLIIICAYNEEKSLPSLLESLRGEEVLVVDDGSSDNTKQIAMSSNAAVISHETRIGKASSLADAISYALQNSYETVIEIGADAFPKMGALSKLQVTLEKEAVGAVSCRQIPVGRSTVAYHIDELIWAILAHGKTLQMVSRGTSHLGAVMFGFKPRLVESVKGTVNDDEEVGVLISKKGYITAFEEDAIVYFDASSCLGHIFERRKRMYYGHMKFSQSTAPSMQISISALALARATFENSKRIPWILPTLCLDLLARLLAWRDSKDHRTSNRYLRWVTTYAKDNTLVIRNSRNR